MLNNDFYVTYLFDSGNRLLVCNYKVTGKHKHISSKKKIVKYVQVFLSQQVIMAFFRYGFSYI